MPKSLFEDELIAGMQQELHKQASAETPKLVQAAECLHAALEIFESQGMKARADQVLKLLQKLADSNEARDVEKMPSLPALMEAGLTQRDMAEFAKGSPIAKAKFNLVLRSLGLSDHQIAKFIGHTNVMSEKDAKEVLDPNRSFSKMWEWMQDPSKPVDPSNIRPGETLEFESVEKPSAPKDEPGEVFEFKSLAQKKTKTPRPDKISDRHTKGLTPEKMVKNLEQHGHPLNLADDQLMDIPLRPSKLTKEDVDVDFADLLDVESFDIDASDDELMGIQVADDSLEVFDAETSLDDFEDERD